MQSRNIYHPLMMLSYKLLPTKVVQSCCIGQKGVGAMLLPKAFHYQCNTINGHTHASARHDINYCTGQGFQYHAPSQGSH
jgi:hypothetical protein